MRSALAAALVVVAAATGAAAAAEDPIPTRDCRSRVESGRAPLPFRGANTLAVGPVAFWGLARAERGLGPRGRDGRYGVKAALSVRAGAPVTISIPERFRDRIGLVYTRVQEPTAEVRFVPCAPGTPAFSYEGRVGAVTGFNGGFSLTREGCYPLDIRVEGGRAYRLRVPFGYPCR